MTRPALTRAENTATEKTGNGIFRPDTIGQIVDMSEASIQSVGKHKKLLGTRAGKIPTLSLGSLQEASKSARGEYLIPAHPLASRLQHKLQKVIDISQ